MNSTKRILLIVFAALAVLSFSLFVSCKNKNKVSESSATAGYSSESNTESNTGNTDNSESKGNSEPTSETKPEESKDEPTSESTASSESTAESESKDEPTSESTESSESAADSESKDESTSEECKHNFVADHDYDNHWEVCLNCDEKRNVEAHKFTEEVKVPDCVYGGHTTHKCDCGYEYTDNDIPNLGHKYENKRDETNHWEECKVCGDKINVAAHSYEDSEIEPTCEEDGYTEHTCSCGYSYKDNEITHSGHNYVTQYDSVHHWQECTKCGGLTEDIPHNLVANGANKKCFGCDITADYTQAENFAYWIAGIKHASTAEDNYTMTKIDMNGETSQTVDIDKTVEARSGNKFYSVEYSGEKNLATGEETAFEFDVLEIVKTVSDGEKIRTKYFYKDIDGNGSENKRGAYVSPRYAEEYNYGSPAKSFYNYKLLLKAATVEELRTLFEADYKEDGGGTSQSSRENDIITASMTRNADGSVTIEFKIQYESQETDWEDVEYTEIGVNSIRYVVKDGKLVSYADDLRFTNKYADETKNISEIELTTIDFVYDEFDEEFYNSVDVTTDNTTNEYTATVYIKVPNADSLFLFTEAYVDETLSVEAIYEDIESDLDFLVGMRGIRVFELYADKDYIVLLTDFTVEDKEYVFYLKFTPPEGKALVVTLFKEKRMKYENGEEYEYEMIVRHTAYLEDIGTRFFATSVHDGHKVLEIDGVADPEYLSFVCDENRVYYILYEGKYAKSEIECKALHEWEYDEYWHWHRCGQHEYEKSGIGRFDETQHDYNEEGVCETCGYRGRE